MSKVVEATATPKQMVPARRPVHPKLVLAALLTGLLSVISACSSGSSVNAASRDRCEARWGVGNCLERSDKWVPLAVATTLSTVAATPTTTAPTTTVTARATSTTTTMTPVSSLDPLNMTYPAGACGDETPAIPVSNGESGPGILSDGPYNGVSVGEVLGQRDFDGSGTNDLEVHLACDFGGNALAIIDYTVIVSEIDGRVVLLSSKEVE